VKPFTKDLWAKQDQHAGDRWRLFRAVGEVIEASRVLYPGSYVDVAPSFVWPSVTYVDSDRRAERFFDDLDGVQEIITQHDPPIRDPAADFIAGDYTDALDHADGSFDLLISLYAGFVSEHCTRYLRIGGTLLVNPSHGDAAMASIDDRYSLRGVVVHRDGEYSIKSDDLDSYLQPKKSIDVTPEYLHRTGRGVGYTKSPFAYLFERVR
jgi:hypothetical protein